MRLETIIQDAAMLKALQSARIFSGRPSSKCDLSNDQKSSKTVTSSFASFFRDPSAVEDFLVQGDAAVSAATSWPPQKVAQLRDQLLQRVAPPVETALQLYQRAQREQVVYATTVPQCVYSQLVESS